MKYLDSKPQSLEETIVNQLSGDIHESKDMNNMCCKNCGDMFGKPTNESSCQYNAYNPEGKNWIEKESYKEEVELDENLEENDKLMMLKLTNKALNAIANSPKQKEIIKQLNVYRKKLGMEPLKEEVELDEVTNEKGDLITAADDFEKAADKQLMDKAKFLKIAALLRKGDTKAVAKIAKSSTPKSRLAIGDYMADNIGPKKASKLLGFKVESVELEEAKVECPECEGKGCNHCDDKGYHMKEEFITEEEIDPQIKRLFRMGLVNKDEMQKALRAFKNPEKSMQNKELRAVMMKVLQKVLKTVENDPSLFQKMKGSLKNVSETVIDEKLDPVNKKAVKKDFDDRKDKDIDNDGDVDDSDEYLHKKRKAISKAMKKEEKLQKINDKIKENKAKYDGRTRDGKSFVERITNNRLKREEKKGNDDQEKKTMTDKPANQIKIHGIYK